MAIKSDIAFRGRRSRIQGLGSANRVEALEYRKRKEKIKRFEARTIDIEEPEPVFDPDSIPTSLRFADARFKTQESNTVSYTGFSLQSHNRDGPLRL